MTRTTTKRAPRRLLMIQVNPSLMLPPKATSDLSIWDNLCIFRPTVSKMWVKFEGNPWCCFLPVYYNSQQILIYILHSGKGAVKTLVKVRPH